MADKEKAIADNYTCANALEHFKQKFLDPLQVRADKNHDYIFSGGYEKDCKAKNVDPDPDVEKRMKTKYDELSFTLKECRDVYNASFEMVKKHEQVINVLTKIRGGMRDNIMWEGKMPEQLMQEQQDMMNTYYRDLNKILATCELEEDEE